jgi:hypothetical protein
MSCSSLFALTNPAIHLKPARVFSKKRQQVVIATDEQGHPATGSLAQAAMFANTIQQCKLASAGISTVVVGNIETA